ncbi:linoleate 13S-lipoxygenase 2-1, chloroplastic-like [Benincasa hispida]|uniref:linoleate 13S-lipoxygenase 2-1, chloroplastic-like n=1 Tax=Benincasa hispida TaxID=102211 RepID=UPI0018FF45F4|nr:linoleate 13S-lipoxygenase 2-1, chloroplastic-like [Benincasa hispida]
MAVNIIAVAIVIPKLNEKIPSDDTLFLKFASSDLDRDGQQKSLIGGEAKLIQNESSEQKYKYVAKIEVPKGFGEIGAVIVELKDNSTEKFIDTVHIANSTSQNLVTFSCNSWVQPKNLIPDQRRIFFSTKSYLPEDTPTGLVKLRVEDLANLKGQKADGTVDTNERKAFERIYDYDVYNDLGDPDVDMKWKRPVLGGSNQYPYPRRCRTGRPASVSDPRSERRGEESFYVPRDEAFSEVKQKMFPSNPGKKDKLGTKPFSDFTQVDLMFRDGIEIPPAAHEILKFNIMSTLNFSNQPAPPSVEPSIIQPDKAQLIKFPPPEALKRDKFNWLSDSEFARQTLAGLNPYCIQLVKSWPLKSELNPEEYGPPESGFTTELVQKLIGNSITVEEAITQKKLFVLDYHDTLMQYVEKVRSIKRTTLYGSRTLFFLNADDTLTPLAIELTRPPMAGKPQWKQVFSPSTHATNAWLWRLAKAHVLAHDSCVHQLIIHWLRTHCCMEPYAIALNRQLSTMHPIYRLLHPHFRFNMRINSNAREILINAGGIIESTFSAASYSMEFSSLVYKKEWQFNTQALPEDLIRRGMAERDESALHGLKLAIKDYPFANDGLILWEALVEWMTEYVNHYYPNEKAIKNDKELKAWWKEIKEKGHPDKKKEAGWPSLKTPKDLIQIVSTIAWVGCGHHSAVNFIQYAHAGYFPSRPSIARTNMPTEDFDQIPEEFISNPEGVMLEAFPSIAQASTVAQTMLILSAHSPDEEYIGKKIEPAWAEDPIIAKAFDKFKMKLDKMEKTIDLRNENNELKNRRGAGLVPYEVLKPTSGFGVTGKGVPYSVST